MAKTTLKAAWCDEMGAQPGSGPRKCPECGAALRERGGRDYCWFCEKEIDLAGGKGASPPGRDDDVRVDAGTVKKEAPSRLDDLLENGPPTIKGEIVFEDDGGDIDEDIDDDEGFEIDETEEAVKDDEPAGQAVIEDPDEGSVEDAPQEEAWDGPGTGVGDEEEGFEVDEDDLVGDDASVEATDQDAEEDIEGGPSPEADEEWELDDVATDLEGHGNNDVRGAQVEGGGEEISFDEDDEFVIDDEALEGTEHPKKRTVPVP